MPGTFNPQDFFQNNPAGKQNGINPGMDWNNQDFSWVEDYVNDILSKAMPGRKTKISGKHEIFETHHYVITRVELPEDADPEDIKVYFQVNELKVTGISETMDTIKLPVNGYHKGSSAVLKDHILEVKIPKKTEDSFQEIDVRVL